MKFFGNGSLQGSSTLRLIGGACLAAAIAGCQLGTETKDDHDHDHGNLDTMGSADLKMQELPPPMPFFIAEAMSPSQPPLDFVMADMPDSALGESAATNCVVNFNDKVGLSILPDKAASTFVVSPYYIHTCPDGYFHLMEAPKTRYVKESSAYNHYHLGFQNDCGNFKTWQNGQCLAPKDVALEPRFVGSHYADQWMRLYAYKKGVNEMTFSLKSILVKPGTSLWLKYRKVDGTWAGWYQINPGLWNLSSAAGIKELLISGTAGQSGPYFFDDIAVSVP